MIHQGVAPDSRWTENAALIITVFGAFNTSAAFFIQRRPVLQ
jgi:hypothetical protein